MPKVKTDTTSNASSKTADAAKVAARLKVIESSAARLVSPFQGLAKLNDQVKQSYFDIYEKVKAETDKNTLDKTETSKMLAVALAKVYTDGDESAVSSNMTANTLKSKFLRMVHPVDAKAAKELAKALEKGVDFNKALLVARGKAKASEVNKKGQHGGAKEKGGSTIDDEETFGNALSAIVAKALDGGEDFPKFKGGLSLDDMEEAFAKVIAGYREKLDGKEADETTENE